MSETSSFIICYLMASAFLRTNRMVLLVFLIIMINMSALFYFVIRPYFNNTVWVPFSSTGEANSILFNNFKQDPTIFISSVRYSLDSECKFDPNDRSTKERKDEFNDIFENGRWGVETSRSGPGSSLDGAYNWLGHLRTLLKHYPIRSIADIPCGDTYWQFSLREINTIEELYFGGDVSTSVIKHNQKLYGLKHQNKLFQYWDLVNCPIPTYTFKNSTHEIKGNRFDLIIVRDALQHMHFRNGLKAVRNVIHSGAKFFALSTYPPNQKSSAPNTRSIGKNESLPTIPTDCGLQDYCTLGVIQEGGMYANNINCEPFNFPLDKAILVQPSHVKFPMEYDEIHIYKIDDQLKKIVDKYVKACSKDGG